jgi:enoyl-CoA hydratase/carnithine racemase
MSTEEARVLDAHIENGVLVLAIDRFARRNSMDQALVNALRETLWRADRDPEVKAIVLQGKSGGFCAGSDLGFISTLSLEDMGRFEQECGDIGRLIGFVSKPVVAAVAGFAIGGGFTLAACCDIVVAGRESRWSMPEVPLGWLTPWGLKPLIERVGTAQARRLCYCLEQLDGKQAQAIGLVDYAVSDDEVEAFALQIAMKLAVLPAPAVAATRRLFAGLMLRDAEAIDFEANRLFLENCREPAATQTLERKRKGVAHE